MLYYNVIIMLNVYVFLYYNADIEDRWLRKYAIEFIRLIFVQKRHDCYAIQASQVSDENWDY